MPVDFANVKFAAFDLTCPEVIFHCASLILFAQVNTASSICRGTERSGVSYILYNSLTVPARALESKSIFVIPH